MNSLAELYQQHAGKISDKWSLYLVEYDRLFQPYRMDPVSLLEIGVQNGGSLSIWANYFERAEKIVGCDINPDCARLRYEDARISVIVGDANSAAIRDRILEITDQFDLIIDDGSHTSGDIIKSFLLYFRNLKEGGLFVAEDLHCSYWKEFDGGLYDPYSSIAFFKHLADIINYEHWGIEKRPIDFLVDFRDKYHVEITEDDLSKIHSVEFINSVCVIRKRAAGENKLGMRVIAGTKEEVVPGHFELNSSVPVALNQSLNPWSNREFSPMREIELLKCEIAELQGKDRVRGSELKRIQVLLSERENVCTSLQNELHAVKNSRSWRVTAPLRYSLNSARKSYRLLVLMRSVVAAQGGIGRTFSKAKSIYKKSGVQGIRHRLHTALYSPLSNASVGANLSDRNDYSEWVRRYDVLTQEHSDVLRNRVDSMQSKPLISVVMPVYNADPGWLSDAIESVRAQIYPYWELCIADDASPDHSSRPLLEHYARTDSRIKVVFREQNGHISAASNSALELVTGDWVVLLDHDDLLAKHALFCVADSINKHPDVKLIYSDEDKIGSNGRRFDPYFKCDWNADLFYSHNLICHLGAYHAELIKEIGGFRVGLEGAQDYDLALRFIERIRADQIFHIPRVLYHWRIHAGSTAQSTDAKPYAIEAGERALNEHFDRQGIKARAKWEGCGYRTVYALPEIAPMVSLIIPTRNAFELISRCVDSILEKTRYPNFEIIVVDNGSDDPETLAYLGSMARQDRVRVIRDERPFNYSALNNKAAEIAHGEFIGLINNDIEVISPDWLSEMVSLASQPGVGAVGARLWYPDDTLQHGGVVLGIGGVAGHSHKHLPKECFGYFSRASLTQGFSALTGACLIVRKSLYEEVGGLNEEQLTVAFNDVDFCLRIRKAGYRNVWTPYAELYHHESATRGLEDSAEKRARFSAEVKYMVEKWGEELRNDPAYSPNLTLDCEDFSLAWPPRVNSLV